MSVLEDKLASFPIIPDKSSVIRFINEYADALKESISETDDVQDLDLTELQEKVAQLWEVIFALSVTATGGGVFEKGTSHDITVSFSCKEGNNPTTVNLVSINGVALEGGATSKLFEGVTETTQYVVSARKGSTTVTSTTTATFVAPIYYGGLSSDNIENGDVDSLAGKVVRTSCGGSYNVTVAAGEYIYICVPSSMTINSVKSSGFDVPMEAADSVVGGELVEEYKCYRTSNKLAAGTYNLVVS